MTPDTRPKTAVLHQFNGIGDLVWMVPYFKAAAEKSRDGQVSVIARPRTFARDLLSHESWVREVIDFDRPRKDAKERSGRHAGFFGLWRMAADLRRCHFDRIYIFGGRPNCAFVAFLAGIPERYGFGAHLLQRPFLNRRPFIKNYRGEAVNPYHDGTSFAIAHGLCDAPIVPEISVPEHWTKQMRARFLHLPRPLFILGIGASFYWKQWGGANFSKLAEALCLRGCGVILAGGPAEASMAEDIKNSLPASLQDAVEILTDTTVLGVAAAAGICDVCVGNDSAVANLAAAVNRPAYIILGPRKLIDHDPKIKCLRHENLHDITADEVLEFMNFKN